MHYNTIKTFVVYASDNYNEEALGVPTFRQRKIAGVFRVFRVSAQLVAEDPCLTPISVSHIAVGLVC